MPLRVLAHLSGSIAACTSSTPTAWSLMERLLSWGRELEHWSARAERNSEDLNMIWSSELAKRTPLIGGSG